MMYRISTRRGWIAGLCTVIAVAISSIGVAGLVEAAPLKNLPPTPFGTLDELKPEARVQAIKDAAREIGWRVTEEAEDSIVLSIVVRSKHHAVVRVGYDVTHFWIDYVSSEGLGYRDGPPRMRNKKAGRKPVPGPHIHGNFNRWVVNLGNKIQAHARFPR